MTSDDFRSSGQRGVGYGLLRFGDRAPANNDAIVDVGAGHVRMFLEASRLDGSEGYQVDAAQWAALDAVLHSLEQRGIYLVLVLSLGPDARAALWESASLQASAIDLWRQIAARVKGRRALGAFDLVNEPVPPGFTFGIRETRWLAFAAKLVVAIRRVDATRVVIVESAPDATGESFKNMRPLPYPNLVYSMHSYAPFNFTHQTIATQHPDLLAWPASDQPGDGLRRGLVDSLEPVASFASRYAVPIYVGEFSAPRWAPGTSAARYVAESIALFEARGWSWCYHELRAWHGWDPEMDGATRAPQPRSRDAPVARVLRKAMRAPRA